jgi:hypothetical protein
MPPRPVCDALVEAFLRFIYPIYPLIDTAKFLGWYVDFWKWSGEESQSAIIPTTLLNDLTGNCLLFAILFAGSSVAPAATWTQPPLRQANKDTIVKQVKAAYLKTLSACDHLEHPTMSTIISELIADPFMRRELESLSNGLFVSSVSRLSQSIGLHWESTGTDLDLPGQQHRRRIWQHIVWMDVQYSIASGLPLCCGMGLVNPLDIATGMPSQEGDSQDQYMMSLLQFAHSETARLEHQLLSLVQNTRMIEEDEYHQLVSEAGAINNKIQTGMLIPSQQGEIRDQSFAYSQWTRIILRMSQINILVLLETPFLEVPSDRDPEIVKRWTR